MKIDPHNKHSDLSPQELESMIGAIPRWLDSTDPRPAKDQLEAKYGMGKLYDMEVTIDKDGGYHSAHAVDDPLWPLVEISIRDELVYVYDYAIVAIVNTKTGKSFTTRMD